MSETINATSRTRRWWTENEDKTLRREAERQLSQGAVKDWNRVAAKLPGRTNKDCRKRWGKVSECLRKGAWTGEEDKRLMDAASRFGLKWTLIAEAVGSRHADQCAKRWQNFLDPSLERLEWTKQDEEKLMGSVQIHGHSWTTIRDMAFPGRSVTDIKNRHTKLVRDGQRAGGSSSSSSSSIDDEQVFMPDAADMSWLDGDLSWADGSGDGMALDPLWSMTPPALPCARADSRVTLILEDVQPDAVGHVMTALINCKSKVRMRVLSQDE